MKVSGERREDECDQDSICIYLVRLYKANANCGEIAHATRNPPEMTEHIFKVNKTCDVQQNFVADL